jgi:DNA polymerase-3 subunit epsilon
MALSIELQRPLVSFDLETTGLDVREDRIVEISCVKIHPDGKREVRTRRLNPGIPISEQASQIHGISDADVADEPNFKSVAKSLLDFLEGCDLTGFNMERFDLPMLKEEFKRCDMIYPTDDIRVIDSRRIFMNKEQRTLAAAYQFYCNQELQDAHSAEADAVAAADVLLAQVTHYDDLPRDIDGLHEYCHPREPNWVDPEGKIIWQNGEAVIQFGKFRNKPLKLLVEQEADYLRWITKANFSPEVIDIVEAALGGDYPQAPEALTERKAS